MTFYKPCKPVAAKGRQGPEDRLGLLWKGKVVILFIALFFIGCGVSRPVIVWEAWGPKPKNGYEDAIQTWRAYKGDGRGYLVYGNGRWAGHVELWINEGSGAQPVGYSPLALSGRIKAMVPITEKESYAADDSPASFPLILKYYHTTASMFKKGWNALLFKIGFFFGRFF
ncbi:MAG: hypothetical protein GY849_10265 [Deltaproteobacteria bacterium]|nr:hypothetical protein [Deltaproteobacteria bacterium]